MNGEWDSPKELWINNYTFLPSFDIRRLQMNEEIYDFDIHSSESNRLANLLNIDYDKLSNYIETNVMIGHKVDGVLSYHKVPFTKCKSKDFEVLYD